MILTTLAAETALLYHLLGIIPGTTGVRHKDGKREASCKSARKKTQDSGYSQNQTYYYRNDDGKKRRDNHLTLSTSRTDLHTSSIIRRSLALKDSLDLTELATNFLNHRFSRTTYSSHRQSTEQEGCHRSQESTHQHLRIDEIHLEEIDEIDGSGIRWIKDVSGCIHILLAILYGTNHGYLDFLNVRCKKRQSCKGCRTDGKTFTCGSSGIAKCIECIGTFTHLLTQSAHLRITSGIVGNRTVSIRCQGDTQR